MIEHKLKFRVIEKNFKIEIVFSFDKWSFSKHCFFNCNKCFEKSINKNWNCKKKLIKFSQTIKWDYFDYWFNCFVIIIYVNESWFFFENKIDFWNVLIFNVFVDLKKSWWWIWKKKFRIMCWWISLNHKSK